MEFGNATEAAAPTPPNLMSLIPFSLIAFGLGMAFSKVARGEHLQDQDNAISDDDFQEVQKRFGQIESAMSALSQSPSNRRADDEEETSPPIAMSEVFEEFLRRRRSRANVRRRRPGMGDGPVSSTVRYLSWLANYLDGAYLSKVREGVVDYLSGNSESLLGTPASWLGLGNGDEEFDYEGEEEYEDEEEKEEVRRRRRKKQRRRRRKKRKQRRRKKNKGERRRRNRKQKRT